MIHIIYLVCILLIKCLLSIGYIKIAYFKIAFNEMTSFHTVQNTVNHIIWTILRTIFILHHLSLIDMRHIISPPKHAHGRCGMDHTV